jgi:hypothetical protein
MNTPRQPGVFRRRRRPTWAARSRSGGARPEHVIDEPITLMLPDGSVAKHALRHEHVVGRLEHPLEVGRIALSQGELFGELVQRDTPGEPSVGSSDLDQPIQAPSDG